MFVTNNPFSIRKRHLGIWAKKSSRGCWWMTHPGWEHQRNGYCVLEAPGVLCGCGFAFQAVACRRRFPAGSETLIQNNLLVNSAEAPPSVVEKTECMGNHPFHLSPWEHETATFFRDTFVK